MATRSSPASSAGPSAKLNSTQTAPVHNHHETPGTPGVFSWLQQVFFPHSFPPPRLLNPPSTPLPLQSPMLPAPSRVSSPELMDDPTISRPAHEHALAGLARINRLSRAATPLWSQIRTIAAAIPHSRVQPITLLDIATGSGDIPIHFHRLASRANLPLQISATDISPQSLDIAKTRASESNCTIRTFAHDILSTPLPVSAHILTCSLFIHHLEPDQAVRALAAMKTATQHTLLVHDLRRSYTGLALAAVIPRLLTRSHIVHVDALRSVRRAYTRAELSAFADQAGLHGHRVINSWPQRLLLTWKRP